LTPTASRENISAIIELTDEKGSRVIGAAHRSGAPSLRDAAAIFARSASLRRDRASRSAENRAADSIVAPSKRRGDSRTSKHRRRPRSAFRFEIEENG
jgi:hypothetical protein